MRKPRCGRSRTFPRCRCKPAICQLAFRHSRHANMPAEISLNPARLFWYGTAAMCCSISRLFLMAVLGVNTNLAADNSTSVDPKHLGAVRKLLRETPLIDGHNDLPWQYRKRSNDFAGIDLRADTKGLKLVTDIPRL